MCVDLASMLVPGEGMLAGSFARGLFLVHSECEESAYINSRPFRVNAGAVSGHGDPGDAGHAAGQSTEDMGGVPCITECAWGYDCLRKEAGTVLRCIGLRRATGQAGLAEDAGACL